MSEQRDAAQDAGSDHDPEPDFTAYDSQHVSFMPGQGGGSFAAFWSSEPVAEVARYYERSYGSPPTITEAGSMTWEQRKPDGPLLRIHTTEVVSAEGPDRPHKVPPEAKTVVKVFGGAKASNRASVLPDESQISRQSRPWYRRRPWRR